MRDAREEALAQLVTAVHRMIRVTVATHGDRTASSTRQLLATLHSEGEMSMRELSAALRIAAPALAHSVAMLEDRGLLTRRLDPSGSRADMIMLTDAGNDEAEAWHAQLSAMILPGLAHLSDDDWEVVAGAAARIASFDGGALTVPPPSEPPGPRPV
ncbi:MarR family winged helix-turn-helix transcriptional regulator [Demequina sp. SYSU T00192]|uniref:MarR family winged helix-turn-helix transcriptional regulator n=1 Tax=Demequina litoralis TaxID=3051660 RepID=A0ABT8G9N9_9MICO|nr:MarR family winged helix-turn-helix transcriptional regulator [Demequina sp. SYSU T00192]MDN4475860.1 MarR family winged helix-turn-helix transcriptional regulator [Demequina sp. SYSU T00192]